MGSFAGTNHPMYILYTGSKMKVETLHHLCHLTHPPAADGNDSLRIRGDHGTADGRKRAPTCSVALRRSDNVIRPRDFMS